MITYIKIEFFGDEGILNCSRIFQVKDKPLKGRSNSDLSDFYIQVDGISGHTKILKEKQLCVLCGGTGGVQYWYAQDESIRVKCPCCSGGNQETWDKEKTQWEGRNR